MGKTASTHLQIPQIWPHLGTFEPSSTRFVGVKTLRMSSVPWVRMFLCHPKKDGYLYIVRMAIKHIPWPDPPFLFGWSNMCPVRQSDRALRCSHRLICRRSPCRCLTTRFVSSSSPCPCAWPSHPAALSSSMLWSRLDRPLSSCCLQHGADEPSAPGPWSFPNEKWKHVVKVEVEEWLLEA